VADLGHRPGLAQEPHPRLLGGVAAQHLDRHPAVEVGIVGGVDQAHAAGAQHPLDHVAAELIAGIRQSPAARRGAAARAPLVAVASSTSGGIGRAV
jgi:hypothetical protein